MLFLLEMVSCNINFSPIFCLGHFAGCHLTIQGDALDQTVTQDCASPVLVTTKSMPTKSTAKSKPKALVPGKARATKRRASKAAAPTTSQAGAASPHEALIGLEEEKGCIVPNNSWQSFLQQDMMTEFPLKPPNTSTPSPNFIYEHAVAPSTSLLPSSAPLVSAASLEPQEDQENIQAKTGKQHRSLQQQTPKSPSLSYASRVEDVSMLSNGDFTHHQRESYIRSRYITSSTGKRYNWQT